MWGTQRSTLALKAEGQLHRPKTVQHLMQGTCYLEECTLKWRFAFWELAHGTAKKETRRED